MRRKRKKGTEPNDWKNLMPLKLLQEDSGWYDTNILVILRSCTEKEIEDALNHVGLLSDS